MGWLEPTKKSITTFIILSIAYLLIILYIGSFCTMMLVVCNEKPHYDVPLSIFPGSKSCQICATNSELIMGYIWMIILYFILPIILIYILSSLLNLKRKME